MIKFRIHFLGGAMEVGKSAFLVESEDASVMLDFGVKLTEPPTYPQVPKKVDAIVLSHCHLDHSGGIPIVHKSAKVPVYATDITLELARLLQLDSLKISTMRGFPSPYTEEDIERMHPDEVPVDFNSSRKIGRNVKFELTRAGHIPGSAAVLMELDGRRLLYTGDINTSDTLLMAAGSVPEADMLILESTYGDRDHPPREETERKFLERIKTTLVGGGVALVPAFGVGRSQEMLLLLQNLEYPVYLDGMAKTATTLMLEYPEYLKDPDELQKAAENAVWIRNNRDRKEAIRQPCAIVTTAGMLTGGPVVKYIQLLNKNKKNSITLTGYQVEGTNGRLLLESGYIIDEMTNRKVKVRLDVEKFDFSAHADHKDILRIVKDVNPEKVALVHGDPQVIEALAKELTPNHKVYTPEVGTTVDIR